MRDHDIAMSRVEGRGELLTSLPVLMPALSGTEATVSTWTLTSSLLAGTQGEPRQDGRGWRRG
jgi:hypothetical protein